MRQMALLFSALAVAFVLVGGTALAESVIRCGDRHNCFGTAGPDLMVSGAENNAMHAYGGRDTLKGRGGYDALYAGEAADVLLGGNGYDQLEGALGNDELVGGPGYDYYEFYANDWGHDTVTDAPLPAVPGGRPSNQLFTDPGVTRNMVIDLDSGPGPEVSTGDGSATVNWHDDAITDVALNGRGRDRVSGNDAANDLGAWGPSEDTVSGMGGDDTIYVDDGSGGDVVYCGEGVSGEEDNDVVYRDPPDVTTGDPGDTIAPDCEVQNDPFGFGLNGAASSLRR
jgi:Ca2+-binding RTX toxin-like protein